MRIASWLSLGLAALGLAAEVAKDEETEVKSISVSRDRVWDGVA